jgi:Caudovirus prohead serine protease
MIATANTNARTIRGVVVPHEAEVERGGRILHVPTNLTFGSKTPLLAHHDQAQPLGKMIASEVDPELGLVCTFKVSRTKLGDEILQLANDGVLGLSAGLRIDPEQTVDLDGEVWILTAECFEISAVTTSALKGADVLAVALSQLHTEEVAIMPSKETTPADVAALSAKVDDLVTLLSSRPEPQPVTVVTREEPLYNLDGNGGRYDFTQDLKLSLHGDRAAAERIEQHFIEKFAVTQGNVSPLTPQGFRNDLYVGERPVQRVFTQIISQGSIPDNNPFGIPKLQNATGPWVRPHVADVEPTEAGGAVWGTQVVQPQPNSGKVRVLQEALDLSGGQVATMLWNKFLAEAEKELEARIVTALSDLTLPADQIVTLSGDGVDLADSWDDLVTDLAEPDRFSGVALETSAFKAFAKSRDRDGRKLFPSVGQIVNGDGSMTPRLRSIDLGGLTGFQAKSASASFIVDASCVWQWSTVPVRFDLKTMVKDMAIGFWMYACEAVIDTSGVIRIEYSA